MSKMWTDCKASRPDSCLYLGSRLARTENGEFIRQMYLDLPRTEPRILPEADSWSPPDMKNHDAMKDKEATGSWENKLDGVLFVRPVSQGQDIPFVMKSSAGLIQLEADSHTVQVTFDGPDQIRLRAKDTGLKIYAPLLDHEAAIDRQDGSYQVFIEATCEIVVNPIRGAAVMTNPWSLWHGGTEKMLIDLEPDAEGYVELAIHVTPSSTERADVYRSFDACAEENEGLYTDWLKANQAEDDQRSYEAWAKVPVLPSMEARAKEASVESEKFRARMEETPLIPQACKEKIILSSVGKHDLRATEFSRRGSFICVLENDADRQLYISVSRSPEMWAQRSHLIRIEPVLGNKVLPYEYDVEPGRLVIRTCAGVVEMCFDKDHRLRIRGTAVHLRMSFSMMLFENVCPLENGTWDVAFNTIGRMLFTPTCGNVYCNGQWVPDNSKADDFIMEWIPDIACGRFEAVVENDYSAVKGADHYDGFDACVADAERDFEEFRTRFPVLKEEYRETARLAAWVIWTHTVGPKGNLKHEVVLMTRIQWLRAFGWQQSYQSMAATGDPKAAAQLLLTMFDYQDKGGQLPDSVGDIGVTYRVTKPALQGLALLHLLDNFDISGVDSALWTELYDKMARFARWWLVSRDRNRSGLPQYFHSDESPGEWCDIFRNGLPVYSPDLVAFVSLLCEGCGRLAGILGKTEEEKTWMQTAKRLIDTMLERLWDGNRFHSEMVKTGTVMESDCVLMILPIMLGNRLPKDVLDKLIHQMLHGEGEHAFKPTGFSLMYNVLLSVGLYNTDHRDIALQIAHMSADTIASVGFSTMGGDDETEQVPADSLQPRKKLPTKTGKWTSWYPACYLIMAGLISMAE